MDKPKVKFSGHQTFPLRYGWLEKTYEFVLGGKSFFHESAIVDLGVGKNMVASIKYWAELAGIIENNDLTTFAKNLLDEKTGWDPYLEDLASWWLLHWRIITNPKFQTSGTALFSHIKTQEFSNSLVTKSVFRSTDPNNRAP